MKIGGLQKTSLIDYPGKICCIIFTQGCNFRCPYCHNPELVLPELFSPSIEEEEIFSFLEKRKKYLDGVSITGGEPCIHKDILAFLEKVKNIGYSVKLDTNGYFPKIIKEAIKRRIVDYIAMDIKGPIEKYSEIAGVKVDVSRILKSIELIKESGIEYEFKTTIVKSQLSKEDFEKIGEMIKGASLYFLQKFKPSKTVKPDFINEETYSEEEFEQIKEIMGKYVKECKIR